ncbi:MAG: ubiquinol-cytochrome C chaperone [Alphaproteobacteria bacterium]|nr:ubiquinol-cytochrome C chaperone [Alphaproteobacteria bacterium]
MVKFLGIYFGRERQEKQRADALYNHLIAASRNPMLYGSSGAPDTANGRFELIILHIFMLFRRMQDNDDQVQFIKQKTFDCFLENMDVNLREIGVGPDGVPKRIQKMLENFYGRAAAYQSAIDENDVEKLAEVIARNFYADGKTNEQGAQHIAQYVFNVIKRLDQTPTDDLLVCNFKYTN